MWELWKRIHGLKQEVCSERTRRDFDGRDCWRFHILKGAKISCLDRCRYIFQQGEIMTCYVAGTNDQLDRDVVSMLAG